MITTNRSYVHSKVVLFTLAFLLLVSIACGLPTQVENPEPTAAATEAPKSDAEVVPSLPPDEPVVATPLPTQSPTATPAAFPTVPADVLKEQLYHATMYISTEDDMCLGTLPGPEAALPAIVPEGRSEMYGSQETHTFCIYGFPFDQENYVTVYAPDGTFMGDGLFKVDSADIENGVQLRNDETGNWFWSGDAMLIEGTPTVRLNLWMPAGLPYGRWSIVFILEGSSGDERIDKNPHKNMAISTLPDGEIDLMPPYPCAVFGPDETVNIYGAGFAPNVELPLGIYNDADTGETVLVDSLMVSSGENGEFAAWVKVKETYPEGRYSIVPNEAVFEGVIEQIDATGCFRVEGTTVETEIVDTGDEFWEPCPGLHLSRLHVGDHAIINVESNLGNRVRSAPDRYIGELLGGIAPGYTLWIIDGPECANGWVWWKVRAEDQDLEGWTPEGDHFEFWVEPIP